MELKSRSHKGRFKTACSRCGKPLEPHRLGKQRYCLSCHTAYAREKRKNKMDTHLHIIHLPDRMDRLQSLMAELQFQEIGEFTVLSGFKDRVANFRGISLAHKQVIRLAKRQRMPNIVIAEDDVKFTAPGAWKYFLEQLELNKEADLFMSMIYEGTIDENNRIVPSAIGFTGMTLYSVNAKFYDVFLGVKEMNNIDRELGTLAGQYDFRVCPEFCAYQMDGFSDNKQEARTYGHLLKGRKMFGINNQ